MYRTELSMNFFTHATLCWPSAVLAMETCMCICVHLSIRESVTRQSSDETDGLIELGFLAWRLPLISPKLCFCVISKIHYGRSFCKKKSPPKSDTFLAKRFVL